MTLPEKIPAPPEVVRLALEEGGRLTATVLSFRTGKHVSLTLAVKKRGPDGRFLSRSTRVGRVGIADGDVIFADTAFGEYVGRLDLRTGEWSFARSAEEAERWTARQLLLYARGGGGLEGQASVMLATECAACGKRLTDPESVTRMLGPDCYGARTSSRAVPRESRKQQEPRPAAASSPERPRPARRVRTPEERRSAREKTRRARGATKPAPDPAGSGSRWGEEAPF